MLVKVESRVLKKETNDFEDSFPSSSPVLSMSKTMYVSTEPKASQTAPVLSRSKPMYISTEPKAAESSPILSSSKPTQISAQTHSSEASSLKPIPSHGVYRATNSTLATSGEYLLQALSTRPDASHDQWKKWVATLIEECNYRYGSSEEENNEYVVFLQNRLLRTLQQLKPDADCSTDGSQ